MYVATVMPVFILICVCYVNKSHKIYAEIGKLQGEAWGGG